VCGCVGERAEVERTAETSRRHKEEEDYGYDLGRCVMSWQTLRDQDGIVEGTIGHSGLLVLRGRRDAEMESSRWFGEEGATSSSPLRLVPKSEFDQSSVKAIMSFPVLK
jgi:hypothetical protein